MKNIVMIFALIGVLVLTGAIGISYAGPSMLAEPHMDTSSNQTVPFLTGKVAETMDSGGYTYIHLEQDGTKVWVAIPITQVTLGQDVSIMPGFTMINFYSKTLKRTFERVVFAGGLKEDASKSTGMHHGGGSEPAAAPAKESKDIKVDKAEDPNAYTVAELHSKRAELNEKSVVLRGEVTKVSQAILGKNWIHIEDGSGDAEDETRDITVTSQDIPSIGDTVTVKGILRKDKDYGSGYFYPVIVEEASIK